MSATGVIVLSSSPPHIFARSPTPVDSPSRRPSPAEIFNTPSSHGRRFQPSSKIRDGFSPRFGSPHSTLCARRGPENVPIRSPGRERFKDFVDEKRMLSPRFVLEKGPAITGSGELREKTAGFNVAKLNDTISGPSVRSLDGVDESRNVEAPLQSEKAVPRRMDWTPPKEPLIAPIDISSSPCLDRSQAFPEGLLQSFGLHCDDHQDSVLDSTLLGPKAGTHRVPIGSLTGLAKAPAHDGKKKDGERASETSAPQKRTKPPAKKALTITKLATSRYSGPDDASNASPMMQYLNSTQARTLDVNDIEQMVTSKRVPSQTKRKVKGVKGKTSVAKVMSPHSAMKAVESQQTVFGSASQLAWDEGGLQQPPADPFSSQQTRPISIESTTPQRGRGTSKFVRTRNLWSVSARDEDNALLYVDSVDLFDSPHVRGAFTGKDVLLEASNKGLSPHVGRWIGNDSPIDIDTFETPPLRSRVLYPGPTPSRSFHTATRVMSPAKATSQNGEMEQRNKNLDTEGMQDAANLGKSFAKKPSYAGLSTHELQKQISSFGFKPVKKREKMIELLDKCWEAKVNKDRPADDDNPAPKHGDFLSNVHDVSARPERKVNKRRKRSKADQADTSPKKAPKQQKKSALSEQLEVRPKRVRKKKSETGMVSETNVVDVDEVDFAASEGPVDATRASDHIHSVPTPFLCVEPDALTTEDRERGSGRLELVTRAAKEALTPPPSANVAMGDMIRAAIMRQADDSSSKSIDHVRNPTWYDKILQYEPVVLEELTVWLNTEGLGLVNEDSEVRATEVRDWCESNGICCLWKGGWRGQMGRGAED